MILVVEVVLVVKKLLPNERSKEADEDKMFSAPDCTTKVSRGVVD